MKNNSQDEAMTMDGAATYRITVQCTVDPSWTSRLAGMSISEKILDNDAVVTILVGRLPDQTALSSTA